MPRKIRNRNQSEEIYAKLRGSLGLQTNTMRFNPKAKLDPSQVEGLSPKSLEAARARRRYEAQLNKWPFLTMEQRMKAHASWARERPGVKSPQVSSVGAWFSKPPKKKR